MFYHNPTNDFVTISLIGESGMESFVWESGETKECSFDDAIVKMMAPQLEQSNEVVKPEIKEKANGSKRRK